MLAIRLSTRSLWLHLALALAYVIPTLAFDSLTGNVTLEGSVGVLLGLYLAAQPARSTIDMLFAGRFAVRTVWATWQGRRWLALNALLLLAGWFVIFLGMVSLIGA